MEATVTPHEQRVQFLHTLAVLAGFPLRFNVELPDGRRPDVIHLDLTRNLLFIGDGKDTETPGCTATRARLHAYFLWVRAHVCSRGGAATVALCFGERSCAERWLSALTDLADDVGVTVDGLGVTEFTMGFVVAWVTSGFRAAPVLEVCP